MYLAENIIIMQFDGLGLSLVTVFTRHIFIVLFDLMVYFFHRFLFKHRLVGTNKPIHTCDIKKVKSVAFIYFKVWGQTKTAENHQNSRTQLINIRFDTSIHNLYIANIEIRVLHIYTIETGQLNCVTSHNSALVD